jgi:hypothetical protein
MGRAVAEAEERRTRDEAAKAVAKSKRGPRGGGLPIPPAPARREHDETRSHKYPDDDEEGDDEARRATRAEATAAAEGYEEEEKAQARRPALLSRQRRRIDDQGGGKSSCVGTADATQRAALLQGSLGKQGGIVVVFALGPRILRGDREEKRRGSSGGERAEQRQQAHMQHKQPPPSAASHESSPWRRGRRQHGKNVFCTDE